MVARSPTESKPPIDYIEQEVDGLMMRPHSRSVIRKAFEGHPIVVHSNNSYINLYHVFERYMETEGLSGWRFARQQIDKHRWECYAVREGEKLPPLELEKNYDPKRGRYKRYAEMLRENAILTFTDRDEAIKARRAWQLYVKKSDRIGKRSTVKQVRNTNKFMVTVVDWEPMERPKR